MAQIVTQDELEKILALAADQDIDVSEAVRRLDILETQPTRYNCGTCQFFKRPRAGAMQGECWRPGGEPHAEHALTVRCDAYVFDDPRASAPLIERRPTNGRMLKE